MSGGGGSGPSTVTQYNVTQPDPIMQQYSQTLLPHISSALSAAQQAQHATLANYPGSTIAELTPQMQGFLKTAWQSSLNPSQAEDMMSRSLYQTVSGQYMPGADTFNQQYLAATAPTRATSHELRHMAYGMPNEAKEQFIRLSDPMVGSMGMLSGYTIDDALLDRYFFGQKPLGEAIVSLDQFGHKVEDWASEDAVNRRIEAGTGELLQSIDDVRAFANAGGPGTEGFDRAYEAAANEITPSVLGQFALAGRSGSNAAQEAMTRQLGDAFARLYDSEENRRLAALQTAGDLGTSYGNLYDSAQAQALQAMGLRGDVLGLETALQKARSDLYMDLEMQRLQAMLGLGDLTTQYANIGSNMYQTGQANKTNLLNIVAGLDTHSSDVYADMAKLAQQQQLQATAMLPTLDAMALGRLGQMEGVAGYLQNRAQGVTNDALQRYLAPNQAATQYAQLVSSLMSGAPMSGGSMQMSTGPNPYQSQSNPVMSGIGGGLTGMRLGSMAGGAMSAAGMGAAMTPYMPLIGGGLGLLAGLFL